MERRTFLQGGAAGTLLLAAEMGRPADAVEVVVQPLGRAAALVGATWTARWIFAPGASPGDFGVYHFRRALALPEKPAAFIVHVSGDNRYQLFVNGRRVVWGPARGDLEHWHFESVDLAPYLSAGRNTLAAVVWNFADQAPEAQITFRSAFLLQGDTQAERAADTGPTWKAFRNEAYSPIPVTSATVNGYYAAGPGERVESERYPWGWQSPDFDDSAWPAAISVTGAAGMEARGTTNWMLTPRTIPLEEQKQERLSVVRRSDGPALPAGFPAAAAPPAPVRFPANTKATYLLDQTYLTTGYPELVTSGGRGASIQLRYAEALQGARGAKGNRNEIEGKNFVGYHDEFRPDGGDQRLYRPLWWRTWRYMELVVETGDEPLTIEDLRSTFTGYPFERTARFEADDAGLARIQEVGWRTARLCAHETYMDCPYYEQLEYVGDTRIQSLISMFSTGDGRLVRNAIDQINNSRDSSGATMSRYPTRLPQFIPSFSLWWIGMLHDYSRYIDDPAFVRRMMPGVRAVLGFFEGYQKAGGSLGALPWWRYMDWVDAWPNGEAPQEPDGSSSSFDFLYVMGLNWAADLEAVFGAQAFSAYYRQQSAALGAACQSLYWDDGRRLYADTPRKASWSQHANVLATLSGVAPANLAADLTVRVLKDATLAPCSLYFRHYLYTALNRTGEGDRYLPELADWYTMIDQNGLTTFSEVLDKPGRPSRSDCHAWSASPNYELLHTVLGVDSAAPHFSRALIRPFLGELKRASGSVPHPKGSIEVTLERSGAGLHASVTLPAGTPGDFVWKGVRRPLQPGSNTLTF